MRPLYETYRPATWGELVGQDKAVKQVETLRRRGLVGRVLWITGASGTGKTTVARLIAAEISGEHATYEIDAADLDLDTVRDWERKSCGRPLGARGWCFIVNEAHRLRGGIVSRLLSTFERDDVQRNATWIFTTTTAGATLFEEGFDAGPFASRAVPLALAQRDLCKPFAERARTIAQAEGLDGQPIARYERLAKDCRNNLRMMLQRIEAGELIAE